MKSQTIDDVDEDVTPTQMVQIWRKNSMGGHAVFLLQSVQGDRIAVDTMVAAFCIVQTTDLWREQGKVSGPSDFDYHSQFLRKT